MTQAQWNSRITQLMTPFDVWQYFKMDEASGMPQDSGEFAASPGCHMTGSSGSTTYQQTGPFDGALGISKSGGIFSSPNYTPTPALDVNWGPAKAFEGWIRLDADPSSDTSILGAGTVAVQARADNKLQIRSFWNPGSVTAASSTALSVGTWYFILCDVTLASGGVNLYINETLEIATASIFWPVPNGGFLRTGPAGYFGEPGTTVAATYSNLALLSGGGHTPDFPAPPVATQVYRRI